MPSVQFSVASRFRSGNETKHLVKPDEQLHQLGYCLDIFELKVSNVAMNFLKLQFQEKTDVDGDRALLFCTHCGAGLVKGSVAVC